MLVSFGAHGCLVLDVPLQEMDIDGRQAGKDPECYGKPKDTCIAFYNNKLPAFQSSMLVSSLGLMAATSSMFPCSRLNHGQLKP